MNSRATSWLLLLVIRTPTLMCGPWSWEYGLQRFGLPLKFGKWTPNQSVRVRIPDSREHIEAWESVSPTRRNVSKRGSPYPTLKGPQPSVGDRMTSSMDQMLHNPCIHWGPQIRGQNQNYKWLAQPCLLGGPKRRECYITPAFFGVLSEGDKIQSDYPTLAFCGAQKWAELLQDPGSLRGPHKGTRSKVATSPPRSWGPTSGLNCYVTRAFSRVPTQRDQMKSGYLTPTFSRAHKWAEVLHNPCVFRGAQTSGQLKGPC